MNKFTAFSIVCAMFALSFFSTYASNEEQLINNVNKYHKYKKQTSFSLIVKFKEQKVHQSLLSTPETSQVLNKKKLTENFNTARFKKTYNIGSNINRAYGIQQLSELSTEFNVEFSHLRSMAMNADLIHVETEDALETQKLIQSMLNSNKFEQVMLDNLVSKQTFNDPKFVEQRHFLAYGFSNRGGQNYLSMREQVVNNLGRKIRIGIADSGAALHEDINERVGGYDFVTTTDDDRFLADEVRDDNPDDVAQLADGSFCHDGHGLSVAGLIAAKSNNNLGVAGTMDSEQVDLIYSRVLDCFGNGKTSDILDAVSWMIGESVPGVPDIDLPVDLINLSLGGHNSNGCGQFEQDVYDKAREKGVVVFVAAGNSNTLASTFTPAACNNVIAVGATTDNGDKARFSNYGEHIDIMAMGDSVHMLASEEFVKRPSLYFIGSGTSMASPNAAAGGGNLLLKYPELTPADLEEMMKANGIAYSDSSLCGQLGCGAGAVDMGKLMSALEDVTTNTKHSVTHRYEGYNNEAQTAWLKEMDNYMNSCNLVKYSWGALGHARENISYNLYKTPITDDSEILETVQLPQKIMVKFNDGELAVQACQGNHCGEINTMSAANLIYPSLCL